jgi:hypothetical protein
MWKFWRYLCCGCHDDTVGFWGLEKNSLFQTAAVECRTCSGSLSQSQRLSKWTKWVW